ncbi:MAG TPA: HAD-IA family hydrolase [Woeseiaceae bacterium]|jgi:phosphoglycolate phosphatase|nr:HAD-IA family hydrolase [Woeseiaceae bacterium]
MNKPESDNAVAYEAVFFDLDGTLVDTAPDMVSILCDLLKDNGFGPLPYATARASVSNGAAGLIKLAFPDIDDVGRQRLHRDYLERYEQAVCVGSVVYPGLLEVLDQLESEGRPWGVVTNKPRRMTEPLLAELGLAGRAACIVSGDTLPQRKPDPAPLLLASRLAGVTPARSVYVGDAERDIAAGRAAGMATIAAAYGYIVAGDDPARWRADRIALDIGALRQMILAN